MDLVNATYGSDQYANKTVYAAFRAFKTAIPIDIEVNDTVVGNTTKVIVTVPVDADYNITLEIDGKVYKPVSVAAGRAVFEVAGLTAGNKTVTAVYAGDNKYLYNATTENFTVSKVKSAINGSLIDVDVDDAYVGQIVRINVTGPSDFNGTVVVEVGGVEYYINMTNGIGFVDVAKLANNTYRVNATLLENDKYETSFNDTETFTVSKWNSTLKVEFNNITLGQNAEFNITVSDYGNVTITIGANTTTVAVKAGLNKVIIPNLKVGTYDVVVKYLGNYKYLENTSSIMSINVGPATPAGGFTVTDLGNRTVIVTVPDNATGNITIKIGDHVYNATINNGSAVIDLLNETPGVKLANVTYSGDKTHTNMSMDKYVTIPKYQTNITIDVNDTVVGNTTVVIVKVPVNLTGNVTIEIDGKKYNESVSQGQAIFYVEGLTAGNKTVTATFDGNDWFVFNSTTQQFKVDKVKSAINGSLINVTVDDIPVGQTARVNVTGPSDFNGTVVVEVAGVK